jgi:uroporphyrinogen decarboxylase
MQKTDYTPIWLMRQAGRYMPEYRKLRERHSIMEIYKTPELSAQVAALPVEQFGVDAAILFADLMTPMEHAGVAFGPVDLVGPGV